ncbi:MAG: IS1380 family transposase [FCB group bacterium]|nr:IS1380 family transposase [FCB group bacterium]
MNSVWQNPAEKSSEISDSSAASSSEPMELSPVKGKRVFVDFDGGQISSDAGALPLKETEHQVGIIEAIKAALNDRRVIHPLAEQLQQRTYQIACGYEDGNDSDMLRNDPVFKICAGKLPDSGEGLSSQPTISRFENAPSRTELYRIALAIVDNFIDSYSEEPKIIVLDYDDTDDPVHGHQQLALFNGYYDEYCYMPLHIFEGISGNLISAILKPGKRLPGKTILAILKRVVARLRKRWKNTLIIFRGDCHFTAPEIMEWIDTQENVSFVTGLTGNAVLKKLAETTIPELSLNCPALSRIRNGYGRLALSLKYCAAERPCGGISVTLDWRFRIFGTEDNYARLRKNRLQYASQRRC